MDETPLLPTEILIVLGINSWPHSQPTWLCNCGAELNTAFAGDDENPSARSPEGQRQLFRPAAAVSIDKSSLLCPSWGGRTQTST